MCTEMLPLEIVWVSAKCEELICEIPIVHFVSVQLDRVWKSKLQTLEWQELCKRKITTELLEELCFQ